MSKSKKNEYWARCQFYKPFVLGGNVWQWQRYKVKAETVKLLEGLKGFVFYDEKHSQRWSIYELTTGGFLGQGKTKEDAVHEANKNIEATPDLKEQIKNMPDIKTLEKVDADDALRRLAKNK